jgi:hypothetical protein
MFDYERQPIVSANAFDGHPEPSVARACSVL